MDLKIINKQTGFTLVEVLVVMLILVALASVTLDFTKDFAFQGRYEVTKDRYEKIKRAIIGRPGVLINGQPDISGFVADMGRLPRNIQELLVQNYCDDDYRISDNTPDSSGISGATGVTPNSWCTTKTPNGTWIQQSSGWKGPYLTVQKPDYKPNAFSDGWGSEASSTVFTDHNYGWYFGGTDSDSDGFFEDLAIQSSGKNGGALNSSDTGYDADYPIATILPSIRNDDWVVDFSSGIQVNFNVPLTNIVSDRSLCITSGGAWKSSCNVDEATCIATTGAALGGDWVSANSFNYCKLKKGDASQFCKKERGTDLRAGRWETCHFLSEQSCQLARGTWREKYTTSTDTTCNEVTAANDCNSFTIKECEGAGGIFEQGKCLICDIEDLAKCNDSGGNPLGSYPLNLATCRKAGGNWDSSAGVCVSPNFCEFGDSQSCRDIGGNWNESCFFDYDTCTDTTAGGINSNFNGTPSCSKSLPMQLLFGTKEATFEINDIVMEIKYINNGAQKTIFSDSASVQENGKTQSIIFSGFKDSATLNLVSNLSIGNISIFLAKNYSTDTDIYPASCSGLNKNDCENADGGITPTTSPASELLDNGMCDNLTISECINTAGKLVRNSIDLIVIPRKKITSISW